MSRRPGWRPALPAAAEAYLEALPAGRVDAFPVQGIDRTGVPVWAVSLAGDDGRWLGSYGYGATDDEALVGAFGELTEYTCSRRALTALPQVEGSWRSITSGGREAVHPWRLGAPAGSPVDGDTPLRWVAARRVVGPDAGAEVWVPLDVACSSAADLPTGYRPYLMPITNGLGAHTSFADAVEHGAGEVAQRDGNGVRFRALDAGTVVEFAPGEPGGEAGEVLDALAAAGVGVTVKLAATEYGTTNLYVVGDGTGVGDANPVMVTACGEAADADPAAALRKAALEHASSRARKAFSHGDLPAVAPLCPDGYLDAASARLDPTCEEPRALAAMLEWLDVGRAELTRRMADRVWRDATRVAWSALAARPTGRGVVGAMADDGLDVLAVDLTPPGGGVAAAKVVVPSLEVETMSYLRIGWRNVARLLERDLGLVGVGSPPPGALAVRILPDDADRIGGPAWIDPAAVDATVAGLYPLYREPGRHAAGLARARS